TNFLAEWSLPGDKNEEKPIHGKPGRVDPEGGGRRGEGEGDLPAPRHQRCDVLQLERQVRWDERLGGEAAPGAGRRSIAVQAHVRGARAGELRAQGPDRSKALRPLEK